MKHWILVLSMMLVALGCGGGTHADAGSDSAVDSSVAMDAGGDSAVDSGLDSGTDSAVDSGTDSVVDSGTDGAVDSGTDSAIDSGTDASAPGCPADPPTDGDSCDAALSCDWLRCASSGHTAATCDGSTWSVTSEACGSFPCEGGGTCTGDQVCRQNVGGAFIADCAANPCGDMPLEKSCACTGCAAENCTIRGRTVTCNTCPSGLCP